jgi:hypothetical protein
VVIVAKPQATINCNRTFGVEIEFLYPEGYSVNSSADEIVDELEAVGISTSWENYTHSVMGCWKLVTDGSVYEDDFDGFELVSPVLNWSRIGEVELALKTLEDIGCVINTRCGIHVHHDVKDYDVMDFVRVLELYKSCEDELDKCVHPTRRKNKNTYCKGLNQLNIQKIRKYVKDIKEQCSEMGYRVSASDAVSSILNQICGDYNTSSPRYLKLNVESFRSYGTIEFRHFHGTLDPVAVKSWILLTQRIVETAKTQTRFHTAPKNWLELTHLLRFLKRGSIPEIAAARKFFDALRKKGEAARVSGYGEWDVYQPAFN